MKYLFAVLFLLVICPHSQAQETEKAKHLGMNNAIMEKILKSETSQLEGVLGNWQVIYRERLLFILTDETNNRMRIFSPFAEEKDLELVAYQNMLTANFHSALDAKYCVYEGFLVSVYTHPLRELTRNQFIDAMQQVANLADNYGTSYSSTELIFNSRSEPSEEEKKALEKEKRLNKKPGDGKS
ncbi:MAG: hypothetical protein AAF985_13965 [Bacteroidota bacterium]